jgi:tetratricopeptide (TPR) repeat protein
MAARKSPSSFIVRLELGRALSLAGDFEKARGELDRALRLAPADAEATNLLAAVQIERGQFEEAAMLLQPLADGNQAPPETSFLLGRALAGQGKRGPALEKFRDAVERDPGFHDAFFEAGTLVRQEGDFQTAFGLLRQACSIAPEEVAYNRALASLVLEQNLEVETGLAACDRLMVTDEGNRWQYLGWIAELYLRRGWKREAVDPLRKAIALVPAAMIADRQDLEKRLAELESGRPLRA